MKPNYLGMFFMGQPFMTDWFGGVHAHRVRFLGVWMTVDEALRRLPEAVRLFEAARN